MKKAVIIFAAVTTLLILIFGGYRIGSGFLIKTDVGLDDFSVSDDGAELTLNTGVYSSMGFTRGFKDKYEGNAHHLTFYSTFGGLNSRFGAKSEHKLTLGKDDAEIYFNRADGEYELVLQKDKETGKWVRPQNGN